MLELKRSRRGDIAPFYVMEAMMAAREREAAGGDVLHLEVGQPATPAPEGVRAAATAALTSDRLGYTDALGMGELRTAIATHYDTSYGVDVSPDRIAVTAGASGACVLAFLACFDPGDRVAIAEPGYPCYRNMLTALGVEVVPIAVDASTRFQVQASHLADLEADGGLDGLVVASPSNPTGTMLGATDLAELGEACVSRGIRLIADEIYHGITYGEAASTAAMIDGAVVVGSFSKYFSMTGWRLGWLALPEDLVRPIERLAQNLFIAASTLSQLAALSAFACGDELDSHVERYTVNRSVLLDGLPHVGLGDLAPADGGFYVWADCSPLGLDSQVLCREWLDECGVAATPGIDFDPVRGGDFVRFSFAGSTEDMVEAMRRLRVWFDGRVAS